MFHIIFAVFILITGTKLQADDVGANSEDQVRSNRSVIVPDADYMDDSANASTIQLSKALLHHAENITNSSISQTTGLPEQLSVLVSQPSNETDLHDDRDSSEIEIHTNQSSNSSAPSSGSDNSTDLSTSQPMPLPEQSPVPVSKPANETANKDVRPDMNTSNNQTLIIVIVIFILVGVCIVVGLVKYCRKRGTTLPPYTSTSAAGTPMEPRDNSVLQWLGDNTIQASLLKRIASITSSSQGPSTPSTRECDDVAVHNKDSKWNSSISSPVNPRKNGQPEARHNESEVFYGSPPCESYRLSTQSQAYRTNAIPQFHRSSRVLRKNDV